MGGFCFCLHASQVIYPTEDTLVIPCCRCLESDRTPRDTLAVLLGRTMLLTVARCFVLGARERERDDFLQVWAALRGVIPYFLGWVCMWCVTSGVS